LSIFNEYSFQDNDILTVPFLLLPIFPILPEMYASMHLYFKNLLLSGLQGIRKRFFLFKKSLFFILLF